MKDILTLVFLGLTFFSFSQKSDSLLLNVESFLITQDFELARNDFNKISIKSGDYLIALNKLFRDTISYAELAVIVEDISVNNPGRLDEIHESFKDRLVVPDGLVINIEFVKFKWLMISVLLNGNKLILADQEFAELDEYLSSYKVTDLNYKRALFYKNIYGIVIETIKEEIDLGIELCNQNMKIARELKDTNLMVISDYYYSDFLIHQGDLEGYISLCYANIELSLKAKVLPEYYYQHQLNLIDALMFKTGSEEEVLNILESLNKNPEFVLKSYSSYLQLIKNLTIDSKISRFILAKFSVETIPQLCDSILFKSKGRIIQNEERLIYRLAAKTLYEHNYYEEAFEMMNSQMKLTKQIYTNDLAKALSLSEIRRADNQRKFEVELESQKGIRKNLYLIVIFFALVIAFMIIYYQVRKNKELVVKAVAVEKKAFEKQLLLKEIHHRVKNNFQIITSLLELQIKEINDPHSYTIIKEGQNRIKSMALIHQKLYKSDDLLIDLEGYIKSLFNDINVVFSECKVDFSIEIKSECQLDIDTAIPLGLILNELIMNAFKYAFRPDRFNKLIIKLINKDGYSQLIISDNGKEEIGTVELNKKNSMGLKLISSLAKQLHGKLEVEKLNGTVVTVTFKDAIQRELVD